MERTVVIETLKKMVEAMKSYERIMLTSERIHALEAAIASLEVDEAYQLEYEYTKEQTDGALDSGDTERA